MKLTQEQQNSRDETLKMLDISLVLMGDERDVTEEEAAFAYEYFEEHDLDWTSYDVFVAIGKGEEYNEEFIKSK